MVSSTKAARAARGNEVRILPVRRQFSGVRHETAKHHPRSEGPTAAQTADQKSLERSCDWSDASKNALECERQTKDHVQHKSDCSESCSCDGREAWRTVRKLEMHALRWFPHRQEPIVRQLQGKSEHGRVSLMVMGSASKAVLSTRVGNGSIPYSSSRTVGGFVANPGMQVRVLSHPPIVEGLRSHRGRG